MPTTRSGSGSSGGGVSTMRTRAACYTSAMDPNASRVSGAAERSLAYLWSCTLTDEDREYTIDSVVLEHHVSIRSICLGPDAKEEFNVVEVAAITREGDETRIPLAVLRLPNLLMAYPSGLELNCPITVKLKSGSGPVYVCGQNVILDYDHESEEEEDDDEEEATAPAAAAAEPEADEDRGDEEGGDEEGGDEEVDEEQQGGSSSAPPPPPPPPPGDEGARKPQKRAASGKREEPETKKKKLDSLPHQEEEKKPHKVKGMDASAASSAEPKRRASKQGGRKKPEAEKHSKSAGKKSA